MCSVQFENLLSYGNSYGFQNRYGKAHVTFECGRHDTYYFQGFFEMNAHLYYRLHETPFGLCVDFQWHAEKLQVPCFRYKPILSSLLFYSWSLLSLKSVWKPSKTRHMWMSLFGIYASIWSTNKQFLCNCLIIIIISTILSLANFIPIHRIRK